MANQLRVVKYHIVLVAQILSHTVSLNVFVRYHEVCREKPLIATSHLSFLHGFAVFSKLAF